MDKLSKEFEAIVINIFKHLSYTVTQIDEHSMQKFDCMFTYKGVTNICEIKFYKTQRYQYQLIESAISQLIKAAKSKNMDHATLVVSCEIPDDQIKAIEKQFGVSILDRNVLLHLVKDNPKLLEEFSSILEIADGFISRKRLTKKRMLKKDQKIVTDYIEVDEGKMLISKLKKLFKGDDHWREYEKLCVDILKYLFGKDLTGWEKQKRTIDGLNRYDLICRIKLISEFWIFIAENLKSRYVVFEFKNYTKEINQGQILTTEKYLLSKALRKVAIILSREGASQSANKMIQGAMREHGKLIVPLSDKDLISMIKNRSNGGDPGDDLFNIVDTFLMTLAR